ncbi:MAG: hypothetical protein M3159_02665, partial [Actinomycetota bacterium]|nr:hypothetical protein [Actinomycetota bacterium]
ARVTAAVSVTPILPEGGDPSIKAMAVRRDGATWAIPWLVLLVMVLVLAFVVIRRLRQTGADAAVNAR